MLISILTIITITISTYTPAIAYNTFSGSKMINGVGSSGNYTRYYWVDTSSLNSTWRTRIDTGMYNWCHTGSQGCGVYTSIWFNKTTTKSSSVIDFYYALLPGGLLGYTQFYTGSGINSTEIFPYNNPQNWVWSKITISSLADSGIYNNTKKLIIVEHELGHAFGLAHVSTSYYSLMHPTIGTVSADKPTADDCYGVNSLYGGYNP